MNADTTTASTAPVVQTAATGEVLECLPGIGGDDFFPSTPSPPRPWGGGRCNDDGDGDKDEDEINKTRSNFIDSSSVEWAEQSTLLDCEEDMAPTLSITDFTEDEEVSGGGTGGVGEVIMQVEPEVAAPAPAVPAVVVASAKPPIMKKVQPKQQGKGKNYVICTHITKATSLPGIRKALKQEIQVVCSQRTKSPCPAAANFLWICLQCGNISCGNESGLEGHAFDHQKVPRSDLHKIAVKFLEGLEIAWCFECNMELETTSTFMKEVMTMLRRNVKIKMALKNEPSPQPARPAIALGPPPPPPIPNLDSPKGSFGKTKIQLKSNQFKSSSSTPSTSFSLKGNGDWPMGLENLGNTCFMNSALQCLSRTRSLINKLDLYGTGNMIEILVTPEEPYVKVINDNVKEDENEPSFVSDECEKFMMDEKVYEFKLEGRHNESRFADDLVNGMGLGSPESENKESFSEEEKGSKDAAADENSPWSKELEEELKKPLQLRLSITKDSMTSKLRHCFKAITRTADVSNGDAYDQSEFHSRYNSFPSVYTPRAVQQAVSKHFRLGQQHDSHELLRTVVDMMKKDQIKAFRLAIMQRYGVKRTEGKNCDPKVAQLLKMWDRQISHKTFMDEVFGGSLVTIKQCMQCKSVKHSHEEFLDLSLPVRVFRANPKPAKKNTYSLFDDDYDYAINRSLEECLKAYTEQEFLTGSNALECENCHQINLQRLANGASYEEVFKTEELKKPSSSNSVTNNKKSTRTVEDEVMDDLNTLETENGPHANFQSLVDPGLEQGYIGGKIEELEESTTNGSATNNEKSTRVGVDDEVMDDLNSPDCGNFGVKLEEPALEEGFLGGELDELQEPSINDKKSTRTVEDEVMDDLDELAVDGVGSTSDIEDDEDNKGNGISHLDLAFMEDCDDTKTPRIAEFLSALPGEVTTASSTVADEGFSEGENSSEEKNSKSLSGSSSRNSISEVEGAVGGAPAENSSETPAKKIPITKSPCSRQQLISRPPDCLTLHLKRFQHTGRGSSKLNEKVAFPYILDLTKFCSQVGEDTARPGYNSIFDEDGEVVYSLYGIVEHSGSLHFGHYVAYVKVPAKSNDSSNFVKDEDKWYYISDSHVSSSSLTSVLSVDAYILFYERIRGDEKKAKCSDYFSIAPEQAEDSGTYGSKYYIK